MIYDNNIKVIVFKQPGNEQDEQRYSRKLMLYMCI